MLKTGMIIAERYEILGKIGTGGMADVYKAKDHKLNRFVAVKVLKPEFREDTTFIRKFRSEAQAAAGLTHPNIVNVFDVGDDEGVYYIVMELIEGITLKEYIAKKGKLSIKEATSIAIQVSMGLEAAHNHGIVHRDVKPQNIIISTDGKVKVTDFGIARAASSNTISSNVMGSVHYSSPEQVRGGYSDEKSDIYSLGITLYEMVTGRVPFDGDTTVAIAIKHLQEEMVPPSVYAEELPYSLEQIILKCTQKSVNRRYGKMEDVIADLKHSLIEPQGDFVKLSSVDNEAKTVVISDEELGEIKHSPKKRTSDIAQLEDEEYDTDYDDGEDDYDDDGDYRRKRSSDKKSRKKHKAPNTGLTILALLAGAAVLVAAIFFIGKAAGIIGGDSSADTSQTGQNTDASTDEEGMVVVPNLVGKTEEEAAALLEKEKLGKQMMGEESSTQEKGRISSQNIAAGTKVEQYTTLKYYISKGQQAVTMPDLSGETGVDAQQTLEDLGLTVNVQKAYSEDDGSGYPLVNPGYVDSYTPEAGSSVSAGDEVTLVVSRGLDYGNSVSVPSVVGMTENDAITTLGKWIDVQVTEQQSSDVASGEVISQDPAADEYADPDQPIEIVVSSGNEAPSSDTEDTSATDNTASAQSTDSTQQSAAAANGEVWKCTQTLNTPTGYQGGQVRLELLQDVNGETQSSIIVDCKQITFPYTLDVTGAPGVSEGTLYVSEVVDGTIQQLGQYPLTFKKAE